MSDNTFKLETADFTRAFSVSDKGFVTSSFKARRKEGAQLIIPTATEGTVTLGGTTYTLGSAGSNGFAYQKHDIETTKDGQILTVTFAAPSNLPAGLKIELIYEAPSCAPVLIKSMRLNNQSKDAIKLDSMMIESFTLLHHPAGDLWLENDYVKDAMKVDKESRTFAYPTDIDRWITIGSIYNSLKVYEFVLPNENEALRNLSYRKATRALFPWSQERIMDIFISPTRNDVQEYYKAVDQSAEVGHEAIVFAHGWIDNVLTSGIFTNYADYIPRPELFPNGWADVKKLTDYAHGKGLKTGFYTIYNVIWDKEKSAAYRDNKWQIVFPQGVNSPWPGMLDPATDWGLFVNRKMEEAIALGGFDGVCLDGPYYGETSFYDGAGFKPGCNQALAWERQVEFYETTRTMGKFNVAAQGFCAMAHGMNRIATSGYDEGEFGTNALWTQILATRKGAWRFTKVNNPDQGNYWMPIVSWLSGPNMLPLEEHTTELNAYAANCYGYGFEGCFFTDQAYGGPKSKAIVMRWIGFWKSHSEFFKKGYILHLIEPDGKKIDAVVHVLEEPTRYRALVIAYNPADAEQSAEVDLSAMDILGWPWKNWQVTSETGEKSQVLDKKVKVSVPAKDARWYEMELKK